MRAAIGYGALTAGAAAAALGIVTILFGVYKDRPVLLRIGRRYVFVTLMAAVAAFATMESALFAHDFSLRYVANNVARATPGLFTFTAAWAALEGSILLWVLALTAYLSVTVWRFRGRATDPLVAWATVVGLGVTLFFFALTLGPANPFREVVGAIPADGRGPNPLLQNHVLVAIHPPMLYLGYVGFTIPFAFAVGALITGRFGEGWLADVRRTTLIAWGLLTVGIVLGAWWSYEVLGWGGYWGWDPVENASLLPWLTGTAFIHSVMVQERRGMLRVWNLSLVLATFCLTILGTFLTRSGVVTSVHSFTQSPIGPWLLTFLGVVAIGCVTLIAWRGDELRSPGRIDSPVSREAAFLMNNLLFAGFALVVLTGTVFPLLAEALQNRTLSVGEPYFERLGVPIGIALLFLMAVGPLLPWRAASGDLLRKRLLIPAWAGGITLVVALLLGARGVAQVLTFALAAFAFASIGRTIGIGIRARRRTHDEALPVATARMVRASPRLYGGLVVHIGVVVIAVALAASSGYVTRREVQLSPGQSAEVRGYTLTYLGSQIERSGQKTTVSARVRIEQGSKDLGVYAPGISTFPNFNSGIGTPSVRTGVLQDVYLTLVSSPTQTGRVALRVQINPMVLWLWIGGGIMALGVALALLPARKRTVLPASDREPLPDEPELVEAANMRGRIRWIALAFGVVVVVFGVVLALNVNGSDPNVTKGRFTGSNDPAPAFTVTTLDGKELSLADLAGKTVVVNFWNSWCQPCQQEAPALATFYDRHKDEPDFAMVGIVRDDTEKAIRNYVKREDVGWTVGFDPKSKAALAYGTTGQPETFVIGPDGRVAGEQFAAVSVDNLETMLRAARGTL